MFLVRWALIVPSSKLTSPRNVLTTEEKAGKLIMPLEASMILVATAQHRIVCR